MVAPEIPRVCEDHDFNLGNCDKCEEQEFANSLIDEIRFSGDIHREITAAQQLVVIDSKFLEVYSFLCKTKDSASLFL